MTWHVLFAGCAGSDGREQAECGSDELHQAHGAGVCYSARVMENAAMAAVALSRGTARAGSLNFEEGCDPSGLTCLATLVSDETGEWFGFEGGRLVGSGEV